MAEGRVSVLRQLVTRAPARRGPGDIQPVLIREWQGCTRPALVVAAMVLVAAAVVGARADEWAVLVTSVVAIMTAPLLGVVTARLLARRRLFPAYRVVAEATRGLERRWKAIDGKGIPATAAEGLVRLGHRTDDQAMSLRLWSCISGWDHLDEARDLIAAWQPSDPASIAYRDRAAVIVAPARGTLNRGEAEQAIARISDSDDALRAMVSMAIQLALEEETAGRDPFLPLLAIAGEVPKAWQEGTKTR